MKNPRQGNKFVFRRVLAALAIALSFAASSATSSSQLAAGGSCEWQTGCGHFPVVCVDKESGKEVSCPPAADQTGQKGENVNEGWQTGLANGD